MKGKLRIARFLLALLLVFSTITVFAEPVSGENTEPSDSGDDVLYLDREGRESDKRIIEIIDYCCMNKITDYYPCGCVYEWIFHKDDIGWWRIPVVKCEGDCIFDQLINNEPEVSLRRSDEELEARMMEMLVALRDRDEGEEFTRPNNEDFKAIIKDLLHVFKSKNNFQDPEFPRDEDIEQNINDLLYELKHNRDFILNFPYAEDEYIDARTIELLEVLLGNGEFEETLEPTDIDYSAFSKSLAIFSYFYFNNPDFIPEADNSDCPHMYLAYFGPSDDYVITHDDEKASIPTTNYECDSCGHITRIVDSDDIKAAYLSLPGYENTLPSFFYDE